MRNRRINPALVISIIALIGSWGGPAVAAKLVDSGDVRDRSLKGRDIASATIGGRQVTGLTGRDIVPDSLQGSDIQERTLGKVAEAAQADEVANVTIERFNYADPKGESQTFYDAGGLQVGGFCNSGVLEARASSTVDDAVMRHTITTPTTQTVVSADNDFDENETIDLLPPGLNDASGTVTLYEPGGETVLVQYLAASGLPAESGHQCIVAGVAVRAER